MSWPLRGHYELLQQRRVKFVLILLKLSNNFTVIEVAAKKCFAFWFFFFSREIPAGWLGNTFKLFTVDLAIWIFLLKQLDDTHSCCNTLSLKASQHLLICSELSSCQSLTHRQCSRELRTKNVTICLTTCFFTRMRCLMFAAKITINAALQTSHSPFVLLHTLTTQRFDRKNPFVC